MASVLSGWSFEGGYEAIGGDGRGWILASVSGVACVLGSCIICIDILTRYIPGMRGFNIRENKTFLAAALSLSFGVMIFSALYGILPEASTYIIRGGKEPTVAKFMSIGFFLIGVLGLSIISELLHRFLPSSIVHCEHAGGGGEEHKDIEEEEMEEEEEEEEIDVDDPRNFNRHNQQTQIGQFSHHHPLSHNHDSLQETAPRGRPRLTTSVTAPHIPSENTPLLDRERQTLIRRPSLKVRLSESVSGLITGKLPSCNGDGPCYGFSENRPCERMCGAHVPPPHVPPPSTRARSIRNSGNGKSVSLIEERIPENPSSDGSEETLITSSNHSHHHHHHHHDTSDNSITTNSNLLDIEAGNHHNHHHHSHHHSHHFNPPPRTKSTTSILSYTHSNAHPPAGHHHVPQNEFLSIGLQTSLAIALHKLPEGFITFATNHANPKLGFAVFLALAIHNISEGFAMSLPLFLAMKSRKRAILWASCLGGLSQPLGAGFAWVWLKNRQNGDGDDGGEQRQVVYGILFAVTAGIMSNVAVQLYGQAVGIYHNQKVPLLFAFIGMGILGTSFAVAE